MWKNLLINSLKSCIFEDKALTIRRVYVFCTKTFAMDRQSAEISGLSLNIHIVSEVWCFDAVMNISC